MSDAEDRQLSLQNEDFDFTDAGVSEAEYNAFLTDVDGLSFVTNLRHSLPLNSVAFTVAPDFEGRIRSEMFPEGVVIEHVTEPSDDTDVSGLRVELMTTRFLCSPEEESTYFPGEYTDIAMGALAVELGLFTEVTEVGAPPQSEPDGTRVSAILDDGVTSTFLFDDLMTFLGYAIDEVHISNGEIESITFQFSESRGWSKSDYADFQTSKLRTYRNAHLDASGPQPLPCGHQATPTISILSDLHDDGVVGFPTVMVGDVACHEIPVVDGEAAFLEVAEWPDGVSAEDRDDDFTSTAIARGYCCEACDVWYPFVDSDAVGDDLMPAGSIELTATVTAVNGNEYVLQHNKFAARPIGYHDDWNINET